jgi:Ca-activated chloride channel family protein
MTEEFGDGSRYDTAMKSIDDFLRYRKGDAFGLTFFGNEYLHWCPLTSDVSAIRCSPPFMRPENIPSHFNGTEIGKAIKACRKVLEDRQEGDKMILLVTDGASADLHSGADVEIAKQMIAANIKVFAVIIGDEPLQDEVKTICHMTGGESFEAGDPAALPEVFKRIDQMKPAKVVKTMPDLSDNFWLFSLVGLCLVGTMALTAFGLRAAPW